MTQVGVVGPIVLPRAIAKAVGEHIHARICSGEPPLLDELNRYASLYGLGSPFEGLDRLSVKLRKAANRRRGRHSDDVKIWAITREEAWAGFHYLALRDLALLAHPDSQEEEVRANREACLALASALHLRTGRRRLSRIRAEAVIQEQREADRWRRSELRTWAKGLEERHRSEDMRNGTPLSPTVKALLERLR